MILVTGANGHLGRATVEHLLARVPGGEMAVSVRDPAKAAALVERGIDVRAGDFAQPAMLERTFAGATQVLLVSSNAAAYGGDTMAQHENVIRAARAAGVRRIVYTSHQSAANGSEFFPARDHAATEALLRGSGLAWTSLRNGFYASSGLDYLMGRAFLETGILEAPADGKTSWTHRDDLAAAAAAILLEEGRFEGPTPPLTGSERLDFADVAAIAADVLGRGIERRVQSDEAFRASVASKGAPPQVAEFSLSFYRAARAGEFDAVDPTLERLIGRPPTTMRELIERSVAR